MTTPETDEVGTSDDDEDEPGDDAAPDGPMAIGREGPQERFDQEDRAQSHQEIGPPVRPGDPVHLAHEEKNAEQDKDESARNFRRIILFWLDVFVHAVPPDSTSGPPRIPQARHPVNAEKDGGGTGGGGAKSGIAIPRHF